LTKRRKSKEYKAIIIEDGSMNVLDKKFKSPSYVALLEIQDAVSVRKTVNGWTSWKNKEGELLFIVIWFLQYCFSQKLPKKKGSTNFRTTPHTNAGTTLVLSYCSCFFLILGDKSRLRTNAYTR